MRRAGSLAGRVERTVGRENDEKILGQLDAGRIAGAVPQSIVASDGGRRKTSGLGLSLD